LSSHAALAACVYGRGHPEAKVSPCSLVIGIRYVLGSQLNHFSNTGQVQDSNFIA
jgi:hypothetical protein